MLTNREMDEIYLLMKQDGFGMKRSRMLITLCSIVKQKKTETG